VKNKVGGNFARPVQVSGASCAKDGEKRAREIPTNSRLSSLACRSRGCQPASAFDPLTDNRTKGILPLNAHKFALPEWYIKLRARESGLCSNNRSVRSMVSGTVEGDTFIEQILLSVPRASTIESAIDALRCAPPMRTDKWFPASIEYRLSTLTDIDKIFMSQQGKRTANPS
jgi:hypothetical protein